MSDFEKFYKAHASEIIQCFILKDWGRFLKILTPFFTEQIEKRGIKPISQYSSSELQELFDGMSATHEAILSYCAHAALQIKLAKLS